jgi:hypothetical protein
MVQVIAHLPGKHKALSWPLVPPKIKINKNFLKTQINKMEKWDLFKLFQELGEGEIKENDGGGESNYDIL